LKRWKNYFSQVLNVHRVNNVRQTEICTAEPSSFAVETVPGDKSTTETMVGMRKDLIPHDVTVLTAMFEV
jgi:hypothetical protein